MSDVLALEARKIPKVEGVERKKIDKNCYKQVFGQQSTARYLMARP
jgi:hypothetical protein